MTTRAGVTLIELIVVLVLLSIVAGVVVLATRATPGVRAEDIALRRVLAARDSALREGRAVSVAVAIGGAEHAATAFPDGRVVADSELHIDPLSGRPDDATR